MKYGDDIIYDLEPETIVGYTLAHDEPVRLELIPGNLYEIHYGIHQGIYKYEGKVADDEKNYPEHRFSIGCHMFRSMSTGELSFGYYGKTSPSEFTAIVKPHTIMSVAIS